MEKALEVMSTEDSASGVSDVSLSSFSAEGAPSTSRSWIRPFLLVAAPFCMVAFGYLGLQAFSGTNTNKKGSSTTTKSFLKGSLSSEMVLNIDKLTTHQSLTGKQLGQINEVFVKEVTNLPNFTERFSKPQHDGDGRNPPKDDQKVWWVATSQGFLSPKMDFARRRWTSYWPASIFQRTSDLGTLGTSSLKLNRRVALGTEAEADTVPTCLSIGQLQFFNPGAKHVGFCRQAMDVLLGSSFGRPSGVQKGGASLAASAFGAWFGGGQLDGQEGVEGKGLWLASQLLEGRARKGHEPLVLNQDLQQKVLEMEEADRDPFLSKLRVGTHFGEDQVESAYAVIVPLFHLMRELASKNMIAVLEVDEFFSGKELAKLFRDLASEEQKESSTDFINVAVAADADPSAAARRCGPRFLARCLLRLEKFEGKRGGFAGADASRDKDAVRYLQKHIPKDLGTRLLPALRKSRLNIWRRGAARDVFTGLDSKLFRVHDNRKGFELISLLEFIGNKVASETAQHFGDQVRNGYENVAFTESTFLLGSEGNGHEDVAFTENTSLLD